MVKSLRSSRYGRLGVAVAVILTFVFALVVHQSVQAQFSGTCPAPNPTKCQVCPPFGAAGTQCFRRSARRLGLRYVLGRGGAMQPGSLLLRRQRLRLCGQSHDGEPPAARESLRRVSHRLPLTSTQTARAASHDVARATTLLFRRSRSWIMNSKSSPIAWRGN